MLDFLRTLFMIRNKQVSVVLWDENETEDSRAFNFIPKNFFLAAGFIGITIVLITVALFRFTPLGLILLNYEEFALRNEVLEVTQRVIGLQDSLHRREAQLKGIQNVIINRLDTSFQVGLIRNFNNVQPIEQNEIQSPDFISANNFWGKMEINFETVSVENPGFPTQPPVAGSITKSFDLISKHFGLDIASTEGEPVNVVADGVVLNADWTLNYGFVIIVQHTRGYVSIYKHTQSPMVEVGNFVQKGAIIASVSKSGLISSGSHLHFEIWLNGRPVDPQIYLLD